MILFAKLLIVIAVVFIIACLINIFTSKESSSIKTSVLSIIIIYAPYLVFLIMYLNGG